MRCHLCNQDSIKIYDGHIKCDICGLDIDVSFSLEDKLFDLFIYNENLEEAEKLGRESYIENKTKEDNPYLLSSDQIALNKKWLDGWERERDIDEKEAFLFSAKKLEEEMKCLIKSRESILGENIRYHLKISKVVDFLKILSRKSYIFGRSYKRELKEIISKIPDK